MNIVLTKTELREIVAKAAEEGIMRGLMAAGALSPIVYKKEAYATYGRWSVDRWIREGLLTEYNDGPGSRVRLDRLELERVAKSSNIGTFKRNKPI